MKKALSYRLVMMTTLVLGLNGAGIAAAQMHGSGHEGHTMGVAQAAPQGVLIRESKVQGYGLAYRLYNWDERNVMMKGMEGHTMPGMDATGKATHHLMLVIKGGDGKEVSGAKVGFLVTGPDKVEHKTLTMGMSGGYGADVILAAKGGYTIKTKAVVGDKTLVEDFAYAVK